MAERHVAALLTRGWSYRQIADARGVAEDTVSAHVSSAMRKVGVDSSRTLVVALASMRTS